MPDSRMIWLLICYMYISAGLTTYLIAVCLDGTPPREVLTHAYMCTLIWPLVICLILWYFFEDIRLGRT